MALKIKKHGVVLRSTKRDFESLGVLNPGIYQTGDFVHMFYRAVDKKFRSSIGYARLKGPTKVIERWEKPIFDRRYKYESKGVEDPRIVKMGDTFYMFYVAHDGENAVTAYAVSDDLRTFKRQGIITPRIDYHKAEKLFLDSRLKDAYYYFASYYEEQAGPGVDLWEKDVFTFPKKIKGKYALIHRILPDIQVLYFDRFSQLKKKEFWKKHLRNISKFVVLENKYWFETRNIGGGCPPIETKDGWLLIYHSVQANNKGRVYHASAALLDKYNPLRVIGRLDYPLFSPTTKWESSGHVSNVVFPTGTAIFGDKLYIYYGAADDKVAVASVNLNQLLRELKKGRKK